MHLFAKIQIYEKKAAKNELNQNEDVFAFILSFYLLHKFQWRNRREIVHDKKFHGCHKNFAHRSIQNCRL